MRLLSLTLLEGPEPWAWYALRAVAPVVAEALLLVRGEGAAQAEKLACALPPGRLQVAAAPPGAWLPQGLALARAAGATHLLLLAAARLWSEADLFWCRRLLDEAETRPGPLPLPPRQHDRRLDPEPTEGVRIRHLAPRILRPTAASLARGRVEAAGPAWLSLAGLAADAAGRLLEPTGQAVAASPWRLELPATGCWDLAEPLPAAGAPFPAWARPPEVLADPEGPGHPRLAGWGRP